MEPTYFGQPERQLFGVYHAPRGKAAQPIRAVLICAPFGQEYIRSHWCLRLLAGQLARKGIHVLRFDYWGIGDSLGDPVDVQALEQWQQDLETAKAWLKNRTGASSCMLLGLGTGAGLAVRQAKRCDDVNSLVLWEPVADGAHWLEKRRKMHREMLDLWVCRMKTHSDNRAEEILGSIYSRELLNDLQQPLFDWAAIELPHLVFDLGIYREQYQTANPMRKVIYTQDENSWDDLRQLETAWLRPQTVRKIAIHTEEVFERLVRFGALVPEKTEMAQ